MKQSFNYDFKLPPLEELDFGILQWHDSDNSSIFKGESPPPYTPSAPVSIDDIDQEKPCRGNAFIDDMWQDDLSYPPDTKESRLLTWEHFSNPSHLEPSATFLSEAGPFAFDAVLRLHAGASYDVYKAGRVVQSLPFLNCLCQLGLGRASVLFSFDFATNTFVRTIDDARFSGCSLAATDSVVQQFMDFGYTMVKLKLFEARTYMKKDAVPAVVALAYCCCDAASCGSVRHAK